MDEIVIPTILESSVVQIESLLIPYVSQSHPIDATPNNYDSDIKINM